MSQLGGARSKLMQSMTELKRGSRHLRKLLREQLDHEASTDPTTQSTSATTAAVDPQLALHAQVNNTINTHTCRVDARVCVSKCVCE